DPCEHRWGGREPPHFRPAASWLVIRRNIACGGMRLGMRGPAMGASNQAGASIGIIATPRMLPRVLKPGDRIERYELVHPIATGGMGSVWAGRLRGTRGFEKPVAIKTVLPHLETDQRVRAMFLDEARLASAIAHRNVAHILDFLECDGALYL